MPVTEAARHHLVSTLEMALDPEAAMTLAELLPPAGWSEVATRRDLEALGRELRTGMDALGRELHTSMDALGGELRTEMDALGRELRTGTDALGRELRTGIETLGRELRTEMDAKLDRLFVRMLRALVVVLGLAVSILAVVIAAYQAWGR